MLMPRSHSSVARLATLALAFCLTLAGCAKHGGEKYFLVTANKKVDYWQAARSGVSDAAGQIGVSVEFAGPDNYDPQAELQALRTAVQANPAGIMISVADPSVMKADIDAAVQKGIPVITIDSDAPGSKRLTFVGTNNYQAGLLGGEAAAKALNGKGTVVVFSMPEQSNLEERLQGYKTAFARYPGIKIDRVVDIKGDPTKAFDATQDIISKKEKIDGFVCLEALAGPEVADVLARNHVEGKVVVAMDANPNTLDWIRKGGIVATIAQKPYTMAYFGLHLLDDLHHNPPKSSPENWEQSTTAPLPTFVDTGATLINKGNVASFAQGAGTK
jgi:ribose transport system substrate-binding protein